MCGIFIYLGIKSITDEKLKQLEVSSSKIKYRGPDEYIKPLLVTDTLAFSFHRLRINGLDEASSQPIFLHNCILICNGEIYNSKALNEKYDLNCTSGSDCECIPALYRKFGFKHAVQMLEGVFSMALYDLNNKTLYIARDPVGIRPLFLIKTPDSYIFASEAKCLIDYGNEIGQFPPGTYATVFIYTDYICYTPMSYIDLFNDVRVDHSYETSVLNIKSKLIHATTCRSLLSDRNVGAFLSGGIDSSIIAAIAKCSIPNLRTFSIGLEDSKDLHFARIAAKAIGTNHTEVKYTIEQGLDCIPEIIKILETSDITTIRASIPMYLLSKYIKENTDVVVLLSGEGSDEIFSGYLYNYSAPSSYDMNTDAIIRIEQLPWYDVLRADRTTASNSLEIRVPFLCKHIIKYVFSLDPNYLNPNCQGIEKKILRDAFREFIPNDEWKQIIDRPKEAFSDGVGYSWKHSLGLHADALITDEELENNKYIYPRPLQKEALLYRKYFESYYPNTYLVPEYWMPSWTQSSDPSATALKIHTELIM